jgi:hypothetical protein
MSELNCFTFGEGEISVVLVHGWAASGRMWENIYPHFTNATFSALEYCGLRKAPCPEIPPTIEAHVARLI